MAPKNERQVVFHPVLFASYPIVFIYASNHESLNFSVLFGPLFVNVSLAALLWWLIHRRLRDLKRSALYASVIVLATYSYGSVREILNSWSAASGFANVSLASQLVGAGMVVVLVCAVVWLTLRKHVDVLTQDFHFDPGTATVYTHAARIPRLSALNPAHQLRRQAPKPVRPLTDVDGTG